MYHQPSFRKFSILTLALGLLALCDLAAQQPPARSNTNPRTPARASGDLVPTDKRSEVGERTAIAPAVRGPAGNRAAGNGPVAGNAQPNANPPLKQEPRRQDLPVAGPPRIEDLLPKPPAWYPLSNQDQDFLDKVLVFWEQQSSKIERYECKVRQWEYDPVFGPKGYNEHKTAGEGEIKYIRPDKGLFRINKVYEWVAQDAKYVKKNVEFDAYWVCDGTYVWNFDAKIDKNSDKKKTVYRTTIPENMRGVAISDGPLPFLFGAEAKKIKERYWIRPLLDIPPDKNQKPDERDYYLEATPKTQSDATNFKAVIIVIDGKDFLPKDMTIYGLTFNPDKGNFARTRLTFEERQVNPKSIRLGSLNPFQKDFLPVKIPSGWEVVDNDIPETAPRTSTSSPLQGPLQGPPQPTIPQEAKQPPNRGAPRTTKR